MRGRFGAEAETDYQTRHSIQISFTGSHEGELIVLMHVHVRTTGVLSYGVCVCVCVCVHMCVCVCIS